MQIYLYTRLHVIAAVKIKYKVVGYDTVLTGKYIYAFWMSLFSQELMNDCEKQLLASLCLSVCLFFRPHSATRLPFDGFP